jgi:hypothetical protein
MSAFQNAMINRSLGDIKNVCRRVVAVPDANIET